MKHTFTVLIISFTIFLGCNSPTKQETKIGAYDNLKNQPKETVYTQTFHRFDKETAEEFAIRLKPDSSEIAHEIIETEALDISKKTIIAFYSQDFISIKEKQEQNRIIGLAFVPTGENKYDRILIDTLYDYSSPFTIEAVFFVNANSDKDRELAILYTYNLNPFHGCDGKAFLTNFYIKPDFRNNKNRFSLLKNLSEKFTGYEAFCKDGSTKEAKFKTVLAVKKELKLLGYK